MSTRRALMYSFLDRYSGLVLSVISSMVIARLLRPDEIGVFSVAMAMLAFTATIRDMGAGQYVVQAPEIDHDRLKTVWTLQFGLGCSLAAVVAALAWPMAAFYAEPRLAPIMGLMALTYLVTPVGSITYALLMREMRFQHVAVMRFSAALVGTVVAIGLALQGHGPISLAWSMLASSCTTALMAQFFRQRGQPWGFSLDGVREVLSFGSRITGSTFTNTLMYSTPDFALGKLQGMTAAGLYSRSNGLVAMFHRLMTDAISGVAMAHFAKGRREARDPAPDFMRAQSYLVTLNAAFALALAALAWPLTHLLYGDQWMDSVALTRLLALAAVLDAPVPVCAALLTGSGRIDLVLKCTLWCAGLSIAALVVGATLSLQGVGVAAMIGALLRGAVWLRAARSVCQFTLGQLLKMLSHSGLTAVFICVPLTPAVLIFGLEPLQHWPVLLAAAPLLLVGLLLAPAVTKHPIHYEINRALERLRPSRSQH